MRDADLLDDLSLREAGPTASFPDPDAGPAGRAPCGLFSRDLPPIWNARPAGTPPLISEIGFRAIHNPLLTWRAMLQPGSRVIDHSRLARLLRSFRPSPERSSVVGRKPDSRVSRSLTCERRCTRSSRQRSKDPGRTPISDPYAAAAASGGECNRSLDLRASIQQPGSGQDRRQEFSIEILSKPPVRTRCVSDAR